MIKRLGALAVFALLTSNSTIADAHLRMTSHQARYGDTMKRGPCGQDGGTRTTDKVYWAKPGTQVLLEWDEFVNHPGHFRIAFDSDGDDDFTEPHIDDPSCEDAAQATPEDCFKKDFALPGWVDNIPDHAAGTENENLYSYMYTLPDTTCDNCTLQVIQVMYDKPPFINAETDPNGNPGNDLYYQCIDLVLDPAGPDTLQLMDGSTSPIDPTDPTDPAGPSVGSQSGCSASGAASFGSAIFLLLAGLGLRRRRQNN